MLTKKLQYQAVIDRVAGLEAAYTAGDFEGYLQQCWEALDRVPQGEAVEAIYQTPGTDADRLELLEMMRKLTPGEKHGLLPTMAELEGSVPPIRWVWKNWIPRGMITLLGAAPGSGKSLVALDLARRIIHQTVFPDGQPVESPNRKVIYVDAEVALPLHVKRAEDWGMDTNLLFMKIPERCGAIDLSNLAQRERLTEEVACNQPELLVLDALGNASSKGENDIEDVRGLMMYFSQLVQDYQTGMVVIHHTRKGLVARGRSSDFTMDDIRGSGHILAMARSILGLSVVQTGEKFDPNGPRKLEVLKTNLCEYPPAIGLELIRRDEGVDMQWGPVASGPERKGYQESCKVWLEALMRSNGEMKPGMVIRMAQEEGYTKNTLYRVKDALGKKIGSTRVKHDPETRWVWRGEEADS